MEEVTALVKDAIDFFYEDPFPGHEYESNGRIIDTWDVVGDVCEGAFAEDVEHAISSCIVDAIGEFNGWPTWAALVAKSFWSGGGICTREPFAKQPGSSFHHSGLTARDTRHLGK